MKYQNNAHIVNTLQYEVSNNFENNCIINYLNSINA